MKPWASIQGWTRCVFPPDFMEQFIELQAAGSNAAHSHPACKRRSRKDHINIRISLAGSLTFWFSHFLVLSLSGSKRHYKKCSFVRSLGSWSLVAPKRRLQSLCEDESRRQWAPDSRRHASEIGAKTD